MERIAVESTLSSIQEQFQSEGYQVELLQPAQLIESTAQEYAAIVISGMQKDLLGMEDIIHDCPIINADGMTSAEVVDQVVQSIHRH